ncbi:hypothetical protein DERP_010919 [Dermatophagoides pteronyssinus]|uniref:Uncharacterized protein n=1 Tax=Dermatophagoides pteronyssinus TaxID=6956 RepID=A0ABQ8JUN4_DERPT|nr:hypothetical protein DERP_010919 [Dermatophagoides pteronyssinus]
MLDSNYFNCLIELLTMFRMLANCFKFQVPIIQDSIQSLKRGFKSIIFVDPTSQIHCKRDMFGRVSNCTYFIMKF